jgi:hypothetical protein
LKIETKTSKEYSMISYVSLIIGILCFLFVFVSPTAIANVGNVIGDYITAILSGLGIILSVMAMTKKTEKKLIPIVSLILSSSFILFWIIMFILLLTGQIEFAP